MKIAELQQKRATAVTQLKALAEKADFNAETDQPEFDRIKKEIEDTDSQIERTKTAQALSASTAQPHVEQPTVTRGSTVTASVETDPYISDEAVKAKGIRGSAKSLQLGGIVKMLGAGGGQIYAAREIAKDTYGENHPVTKALLASTGTAGGFVVPPDQVSSVIELLRSQAVVRAAGPRNIPMPRGTLTLPAQASAATASYGAEGSKIAASQQSLKQIVASYKKLTALVPVSNDLMRYADPSIDAFVRDDLVKVIGLREDLAFLTGDGTQDTPRGWLSFAGAYAAANGGTAPLYSTSGNSTAASGGNFLSSTSSFTLATVASELAGLVNKLDTANVPDSRRRWFFHPRTYNYLFNVQNSLGVYVYRDELSKGTLLGYPFSKTTQMPVNIKNADSSQSDCSFVFLVEMDETLLLDSMTLELAVSREGSYIGSDGSTYSAFQYDQTLIRCISEHDFAVRHDASIAVAQFVRWAPALT